MACSQAFRIFVPSKPSLIFQVKRKPYVGSIIHKAAIEVDEKGTQAAAATAIEVVLECCKIEEPIYVTLDRPFCFFIMSTSDEVCFAGVCADP